MPPVPELFQAGLGLLAADLSSGSPAPGQAAPAGVTVSLRAKAARRQPTFINPNHVN